MDFSSRSVVSSDDLARLPRLLDATELHLQREDDGQRQTGVIGATGITCIRTPALAFDSRSRYYPRNRGTHRYLHPRDYIASASSIP
jgi:hypothetical protein